MITHGLGIFTPSFLFHANSPEKTSRCFRTSRTRLQRKRHVRDSSSIKCGKLSEYGHEGISYMTRLIWYRQHHLISWPVLNAEPYNRQKSFLAFYTAVSVVGIYN